MATDFDQLFRSEYPRLVRALTFACGDAELAADVAQEAFLQAHRHWRRVSSYADPGMWLSRVAVNRLSNRQRDRRRLQLFLARASRADDPPSPHDVVGSLDIRAAVARLPRQQRLSVGLHYFLDLSVAEVAQTLDVAPVTVRSHLHTARQSLASALGDDGDAFDQPVDAHPGRRPADELSDSERRST